jgi:hypothetical protein
LTLIFVTFPAQAEGVNYREFFSVEGSMTQQPPAKTSEQTLEEESSAKKHPSYTKPTLKKLGRKPPDDLSEEFRELLGH